MSVISSASGSSCWRGLDYYQNNKIKNIKKISDIEYISIVSGTNDYNVYLNLKKPRTSTCNCSFADGRMVICKHIVATYFYVVPGSADAFVEEQNKLQEEYEEYCEEQYQNVIKYINKMKKSELVEEFICLLNHAPDWVYEDFVNNHDIDI